MTDAISAPDPSTLGVAVELVHLPIKISTDHLRDVYVEVSGPCGYENFTRQANGACLETVADAENGASRVTIGRDRLIFQEEGAAAGSDVLARRIEEVVRSLQKRVNIPVIVARTRTHRTLMQVPGGGEASQWLSEHAFAIDGENFQAFDRPVRFSGLRLQLPPQIQGEALHLIRIEAWLKDPRAFYVEDAATWRQPLPTDQMKQLATDLKSAEEITAARIPQWLASLES